MTRRLLPCAGLVLVLILCQTAFEQPAQLAASKATVIQLYGTVQTRHGAGGYHAGRVGEVLMPGDAIKTGANSRAQLAIGTNQFVRMDQNSQVLITHVQESGLTSFTTLVGGVWVTIQKALGVPTKFEVHTPSVVAAARGTIFRCAVAGDGDTSVFVYEGQVDVTGAGEVVQVAPDQFARALKGLKPALAAINADEDERRDFVRYNRHCETLSGIGNPRVLVALSVVEGTKPLAALPTSGKLVQELRQLGYDAIPVRPEHLRDATYDQQGVLKVKPKLADYYLVGAIRVQLPAFKQGGPLTGTAYVRAKLVGADDYHLVSAAEAQSTFTLKPRKPFGLPDGQDRQPVVEALSSLGTEVARQMAPQLMSSIVADHPSAVRVDLVAVTDQRQIRGAKALLGGLQDSGRITPLPRFDGTVSLLVATAMTPQQVAQYCLDRGGQWIQNAETRGRVVTVSFRAGAAPPADALTPNR